MIALQSLCLVVITAWHGTPSPVMSHMKLPSQAHWVMLELQMTLLVNTCTFFEAALDACCIQAALAQSDCTQVVMST